MRGTAAPRRSGALVSQTTSKAADLTLGGVTVTPGETRRLEIPVAKLPTGTWQHLRLVVVNGRRAGKHLWLSAALHGDELNGVEIIRRVMRKIDPRKLSGAVIAAPVVNVFGFINQSRYLPDRRDLNRCFPGSPSGSLASRIAHLFMEEVVARADYGIDLHTGANHRTNLPQVRADLEDTETRRCARAFGAPLLMHARVRDGSLRGAASARGGHALLYEGGESHRFDPVAIRLGVQGILRVMAALRMRPAERSPLPYEPFEAVRGRWVRARQSGILRMRVRLGQKVSKGDLLGRIADPFEEETFEVKAPLEGMVASQTRNPVVSRGDALVQLAI
jgi:predicted deacylase